jgi:hypothetical protein
MEKKQKIHFTFSPTFGMEKSIYACFRSQRMDFKKESRSSSPTLKQQGFIAILLLSILPILMAAIVALLLSLSTQQALMAGRYACRKGLLRYQEQSAQQLTSLLAFNEKIRLLRIENGALKLQLAAAIASQNLPAVAMAQHRLKLVQQHMTVIDISQRSILNASRMLKLQTQSELAAQIIKGRPESSRISPFMRVSFTNPATELRTLAVVPDRPGSLAPIYEPQEPFIENQSSQASWSVRIGIEKIHKFYPWLSSRVQWKESCGASLKKEAHQWQPRLVTARAVRFLSRL